MQDKPSFPRALDAFRDSGFGTLFFSLHNNLFTVRGCQGYKGTYRSFYRSPRVMNRSTLFPTYPETDSRLLRVQIHRLYTGQLQNRGRETVSHVRIWPETIIFLYLEGVIDEQQIHGAKLIPHYQDKHSSSQMSAILFDSINISLPRELPLLVSLVVVLPEEGDRPSDHIICVQKDDFTLCL